MATTSRATSRAGSSRATSAQGDSGQEASEQAVSGPKPPSPAAVRQEASQQELFRFLEDRFACAQACADCARSSALRASMMDPGGPKKRESARRSGILCAEVCEATCHVLSRQPAQDERTVRAQVEWCRDVCLECAEAFDGCPGAEAAARTCRDCAQACEDFIATLG